DRDDVNVPQARPDGTALGPVRDFDRTLLNAVAQFQEHDALAVLVEAGLSRHMQDVVQLPPRDLEPRGRTGAEPRIDLVELERDVELPRRVRLPEIPARGEAGQRAHTRDERFPRQRIDLDFRRL